MHEEYSAIYKESDICGIYRISIYYDQLNKLLNSLFDADLDTVDEESSKMYDDIWFKIRNDIILNPILEEVDVDYWRPLPLNLKSKNVRRLKVEWESHGKIRCEEFMEFIKEELSFYKIKSCPLEEHEYEFLASVKELIEKNYKKSRDIISDKNEIFNKELFRLLLFYKQLINLLEVYFNGYLITTDEINNNYLRLCHKVGEILEKPGFEVLTEEEYAPFSNLRSLDPDCPDCEWHYGGNQLCGNFLSSIETIFIKTGEKKYDLDSDDCMLLKSIDDYLDNYKDYKKKENEKWLQKVEKGAEIFNSRFNKVQNNLKFSEFNFKFIKNQRIKELLISDSKEVQGTFENGLHKSTMVLCGAILESLLIASLYSIEKEANDEFRQKYPKKYDKSKKIEKWQMYQLIEIAKRLGIISEDVSKFSHILRDYRNLVHLYVQKKDNLQVNEKIAQIMINLLDITYDDILSWHDDNTKNQHDS